MKVRSWGGSEEDLPIAHAIYKEVDWADDRGAVEDLRKKLYGCNFTSDAGPVFMVKK